MNKTTLKADPALIGKLISVEIEYYPTAGANDVSTTAPADPEALINVADDISVRGGKEIRVLTLTDDADRIKEITALNIKGTVNKNCGLHVHIDARHLGQNGLLSVEETYDRLTSPTISYCFKKLVPKSRKSGNRFCVWKSNRNYGRNRQCAFNFHAFRRHQTIEFRMQSGSTNPHKIEMWALVCKFWLNYVANPANVMPTTWATFIQAMPEPIRSFCILRQAHLSATGANAIRLSTRLMASLVEGIEE